MQKLLVISLLFGIAFGANHPLCGQKSINRDNSDSYIVGGVEAVPYSWPWQVSLLYNSDQVGWYHTCGASVISDEWILTAAHCVDRNKDTPATRPNWYRCVVGDHDKSVIEGKESTIQVVKVIQHPQWDANKIINDVALLKLNRKIDFSGNESHVRPVCLPDSQPVDQIANTECTATGWGVEQWQAPATPDKLNEVKIKIVAQATCRSKYLFVTSISDAHICFGENGKGTCQGDSGGPLNCQVGGKWYNYGATSFGVQCAGSYPSVSARVSTFSSWIWSTVDSN